MVYRIDRNDCLTFLSADWALAAKMSGGYASTPEYLLGRRLWNLVTDAKVIALYSNIVARVRAGHPASFSYRCDTVTRERTFRMKIRLTEGNEVEFVTTPEQEIERAPVALLNAGLACDENRVIRICSTCQRAELPVDYWVPVETAVELGNLLVADRLPRLQHCLCPACETRFQ